MTTTERYPVGLTLEELERQAYANGDVQTSQLIVRALEEADPVDVQSAYDSGYDAGKSGQRCPCGCGEEF